ncbi:12008_t:CDS:2 [Ambispora gerdemannii]|uniref:Tyrosine--tRNA ligase n=1 Tax=Ambispora gerdemannii TaxID=144530 RepID=A0A9N8VYS7_9GLOM|nr:12008_t:CDS:2 [Ambispora gerdemannii]
MKFACDFYKLYKTYPLLIKRIQHSKPTYFFRSFVSSATVKSLYDNNAVAELNQRGLVNALTSPEVQERVNSPATIYCGVDPTASSLHVGNLLTLIGLLHFYVRGHNLGGATGSIGDPSGRKTERQILEIDTITSNIKHLDVQIQKFFNNGIIYATKHGDIKKSSYKILNNNNWYENMSITDFLREIGRFARIGSMLTRESVKVRMENAQGISFTEFSYQLLQAYDYWYLYNHFNCRIQLGGSDQWGNIIAGIDLINRKNHIESQKEKAYGVTMPLLLTSAGEKFGKSAGNAVWLDENKTSAYDFYQDMPEKHYAQTQLANEVTELVHGEIGLKKAQLATRILFGSSLEDVQGYDLLEAFNGDARLTSSPKDNVMNICVDRVACNANVCKTRNETQKFIKNGGLYLNNQRVTDPFYKICEKDLIDGLVCVFRLGKSNYRLLKVL